MSLWDFQKFLLSFIKQNQLYNMETNIIRWIVPLVIGGLIFWALIQAFNPKSSFNAALRNSDKNSKYSLAKVQLFWWTVIISTCFAISYAATGNIQNVLNTSCLVLLGISLGTTAAGKVIDNSEEANLAVRHQTMNPRNFWMDILSDYQGVNLHRFQAVIFTLLFGIVFIIQFFQADMTQLPAFDTTTLGLLGVSSGGFVALKFNENLSKRAEKQMLDKLNEQKKTT